MKHPGPSGDRDARPASRIQAASSSAFGIDTLITLAVGIALVAVLYLASAVLIPITLAIMLSFLVAPLANLLMRFRFGHVASVIASVVLSLSMIVLFGTVIANQLNDLANGIPRYQETIENKLETAHSLTIGRLNKVFGIAGQALQRATVDQPAQPEPGAAATPATPSKASGAHAASGAMPVEVREPMPSPFELARRVLSPAVSPLETAFIVFVVSVVILLQRDDLRDRAIRLFGSRDLHRTTTVMDEAARRLSRYFVSQLGVNTGVGVCIGAGLFVIGVPSPILWGIMAALLRLVPYVGIWISAVLATALAAAVSPGWSMALWSIALFIFVEVVVGQIVEPFLYGHSTGLSPFSVVVAAIFWSWIWGPIGLILSTPLTLCLLVLGRHVRRLEFLDVLLGDQPALTPVENFYQRALAGDADDALEQAETLLRQYSLSAYYDAVALPGLRLAAHDVDRGSVTAPQLARIEATTNDLIDALDGYDDRDPPRRPGAEADATLAAVPPPSRDEEAIAARAAAACHIANDAPDPLSGEAGPLAPPRVLCIPGRGPIDTLTSTILLQLLGKHAFAARALPLEAASRASIDTLDVADVSIICIFALKLTGAPSHLRYLVRRLRQRAPNAAIVVGVWPDGAPDDAQADPQSRIDADYLATSLCDLMAACRRMAAAGSPVRPRGEAREVESDDGQERSGPPDLRAASSVTCASKRDDPAAA